MSSKQETLFSLDLVIDYVHFEESHANILDIAVGIRFLDFPTLLIYQPGREDHQSKSSYSDLCLSSEALSQPEDGDDLKFPFHKGKSCLFKINLDLLHSHLLNTPLYAMVLDVTGEIPKLKGSTLISLAKVTGRIKEEVIQHGINTPAAHGERLIRPFYNLMGQSKGVISLAYKVVSLGGHLIPHIPDHIVYEVKVTAAKDQHAEDAHLEKEFKEFLSEAPDKVMPQQTALDGKTAAKVISPAKQPVVGTFTETQPHSWDEDEQENSSFCPPPLFYFSGESSQQEKKCFTGSFTGLERKMDVKEPEEDGNEEIESFQNIDGSRKLTSTPKLRSKETVSAPLVDAIRQLPLLNALLMELSQLNIHTQDQQTLSVHPKLSWLYTSEQEPPLFETKSDSGKKDKSSVNNKTSLKQTPGLETKSGIHSSKCIKKKMQPKRTLKYGLTNTFKLRLQLVKKSPPKKYKCMEYHNENLAQPKRLSSYDEKNVGKSFSRGFQQKEIDAMKFSREPVETKALYKRSAKQSPGNNDEQNKEDVMEEKGKKVPISASSGHESKWNDPGFKENSTEDHSGHLDLSNGSFLQDIDYCDDFTSVNTTDGFSPEPISSPITNLQKTKSHSSSSDASRHSKTLPVPAKAENSPQRSLKSTHVIRPRLQTSALSVSSDDDEYLISGKFGQRNTPLVRRGFVGETSSNDSSISSKNMSLKLVQESKDSAPNKPVLMNQSSSDPSHGENEQDNLASLGLDRKYHHISELVVNKLPGYTL